MAPKHKIRVEVVDFGKLGEKKASKKEKNKKIEYGCRNCGENQVELFPSSMTGLVRRIVTCSSCRYNGSYTFYV